MNFHGLRWFLGCSSQRREGIHLSNALYSLGPIKLRSNAVEVHYCKKVCHYVHHFRALWRAHAWWGRDPICLVCHHARFHCPKIRLDFSSSTSKKNTALPLWWAEWLEMRFLWRSWIWSLRSLFYLEGRQLLGTARIVTTRWKGNFSASNHDWVGILCSEAYVGSMFRVPSNLRIRKLRTTDFLKYRLALTQQK